MMDKEHLHLLIHEEIYLIEDESMLMTSEPNEEKSISEEHLTTGKSTREPETIHIEEKELAAEHQEETPKIPSVQHASKPEKEQTAIPFAVFHEATDQVEIELLQKIIAACGLESDQYQVFANGFNKEVLFKKALVFVPEAKAFYTPIPYKKSEFLCSKPLSLLEQDVKEKAKLWNALKAFV